MALCPICKKQAWALVSTHGKTICYECYLEEERRRVLAGGESIQKPSDFSQWKGSDLSELFWLHLAEYRKNPNPRSFDLISLAYRWACHDNHALANSMTHALEWCGVDLFDERERWRNRDGE